MRANERVHGQSPLLFVGQSLLVNVQRHHGMNLSASGWTWGYCGIATASGSHYIVDAQCGDGRRFIVESDELLTAFVELEAALLL
jgi:hypothetical protein